MSTASQVGALPAVAGAINSRKTSGGIQMLAKQLLSSINWILQRVKVQPKRKTLRLCENLSLGDKRFVAVVQVDRERFLIGGAAGSVSLLTRLQETTTFSESLQSKLKEEGAR